MRRLLVLVLLLLAYVGCARTGPVDVAPTSPPAEPRPVPPPEERPIGPDPSSIPPVRPRPEDLIPSPEPRLGGVIRFLVTDPSVHPSLIRSNVAVGLTADGLLLSWSRPRPERPCWVFELNPRWTWPGDRAVRADDLVGAWTTDLLDEQSDLQWLLGPVNAGSGSGADRVGGEGRMRAEGQILEICPARPAPDLPERLAHPALWLQRVAPSTGLMEGPGPFLTTAEGVLAANRDYPGPGPYVEQLVPLEVEGHSSLLLRLGDAHVAVTFAEDADDLIEDPASDLRLERLPGWDRTYFMWLNPSRRWVNDPVFRRWLGGAIDRNEMIDYLFDGRGKRAYSLSHGGSAIAVYKPRPDRPLSPMTRPRLQMVYDVDDPYSATVAHRIQAVLETKQVELSIVPMELRQIRRALRDDQVEIALLAHRPGSEDPVLALEGTMWWLGPGAEEGWAALVEASAIDPRHMAARAAAAWEAEQILLGEARVIPLIRLHAWLAYRSSLAGLDPGPAGEFRLGEAWWLP